VSVRSRDATSGRLATAGPITLAALAPGARARVTGIRSQDDFALRLMELGLTPGTEVALIRRAPFGDPIELVVRGSHFSIRRSEAERIHVEVV
jgi:ferrous iron transport protein A